MRLFLICHDMEIRFSTLRIASPYDPSEAMTFKRFYGLPEDLELTVISYPEWYTLRESK